MNGRNERWSAVDWCWEASERKREAGVRDEVLADIAKWTREGNRVAILECATADYGGFNEFARFLYLEALGYSLDGAGVIAARRELADLI